MRLALAALLALAGCATLDAGDAETFAGAALGAAAGSFAALAVAPQAQPAPAPVVVPVVQEPDGGAAVDWPDAGGPCSPVGDRVCCVPSALQQLLHRDAGPPPAPASSSPP